MEPRERYKPNPKYNGRKEKDGFVCGNPTSGVLWCVAVKINSDSVQVRDTKDLSDTTLTFTKDEWRAFTVGVKDKEFDV